VTPAAPGSTLPPICILAGGRGTRLARAAGRTPKALVEVAGAPFIHHQLRLLADHSAGRVVLCVGYLGEQIERAVGDGSQFGLSITYAYDPPELAGTAGAVRGALPQLGDAFLVLYGDTYLRIDYGDFASTFLGSELPAQMAVLRNEGRWDASNVEYDGELVIRHDKANPNRSMKWIDYGLGAFRAEVFTTGPGASAADLSETYSELASGGLLGGYLASKRFYEIGTPQSLAETDHFLRSLPEGS
jgi:N-acetyl-alpha-D-muramate 1-phosphate uridylyltransferase